MEMIAAFCSDLILSQNKEHIQTALKVGICGAEKTKHLGNGINLSRFNPTQVSNAVVLENERIIVYILIHQ
jgi:hypothetical protein